MTFPTTRRPERTSRSTIIVFGSILIGHPFTESYARETVPEEYWDTP